MENALKNPLQFYKALLNTESELGVGIAVSKDKKLLYVNEALLSVYGYSFEELQQIGSFLCLVIEEERPRLQKRLEEHEAGKIEYSGGETKARCKDGRIIDIEYITRNFVADGSLYKLSLSRNITEKKNAERKALHTEWLLKEAQVLSKIGNWNVDFITNEAFWSEGLRVIRGVDKDLVADFDGFINMIHPDDREQTVAKIMKAREASTAAEMEYRFIRGDDGAERIFRDTINIERDSNGKLKRLFGFSQDITEQRIAEREIEHLNTLIYQMSHDIRGPLNSAKNLLYISQGKVKDKKALEYLRKIEHSYMQLEKTVMSLYDLQKINYSSVILEKIDIAQLIEEIIQSLLNLPGLEGVKISTHIEVPDGFQSDRQFVHSILYNLIHNSLKFKRDITGSALNISAICRDGKLILKVADNGQGIPSDIKERVFDRFYSADTTVKGTGMGLYIVKCIVDKMKGTIDLESEYMKGSVFTINLPLYNCKDKGCICTGNV